jgi:hypothetical protein
VVATVPLFVRSPMAWWTRAQRRKRRRAGQRRDRLHFLSLFLVLRQLWSRFRADEIVVWNPTSPFTNSEPRRSAGPHMPRTVPTIQLTRKQGGRRYPPHDPDPLVSAGGEAEQRACMVSQLRSWSARPRTRAGWYWATRSEEPVGQGEGLGPFRFFLLSFLIIFFYLDFEFQI